MHHVNGSTAVLGSVLSVSYYVHDGSSSYSWCHSQPVARLPPEGEACLCALSQGFVVVPPLLVISLSAAAAPHQMLIPSAAQGSCC